MLSIGKLSMPFEAVVSGHSVYLLYLIPQNSKRFSDSEESTNPAVRVTERKS